MLKIFERSSNKWAIIDQYINTKFNIEALRDNKGKENINDIQKIIVDSLPKNKINPVDKRKYENSDDEIDTNIKKRKIEIGINLDSDVAKIRDWFQTYKNGKFADLVQFFDGIDGSTLLSQSKEDLLQ